MVSVQDIKSNLTTLLDRIYAKAVHSHGDIDNNGAIGSSSNKIITTGTNGKLRASDAISKSQISDFPTSMAPTAHTHTTSEITNFPTSMTPTEHTHGYIQNDGKINTTNNANKNVVTDANGKVTIEDKVGIATIGKDGLMSSSYFTALAGLIDDFQNAQYKHLNEGIKLYKYGQVVCIHFDSWLANKPKDNTYYEIGITLEEKYRPVHVVYIPDAVAKAHIVIGNDGVIHMMMDPNAEGHFHCQASWITNG